MSELNNDNYWQNKLEAWLYYPVTKIFGVSMYRHMNNTVRQIIFGTPALNGWQDKKTDGQGNNIELGDEYLRFLKADMIASEMTRAAVPAYNETDKNQNGAIDFKSCAEINHPLVSGKKLKIELPELQKECFSLDEHKTKSQEEKDRIAESFMSEITAILQEVVNDASYKALSDNEEKYRYLFDHMFFVFSRRLRGENVKGLGALWDLIPSDTRIPDHSVWNHSGLASAIYSSMKNKDDDNISLCVYSISPVQDFIGKARKLRDFWTGSVILSYLSFMGISYVMKKLGPDHIVYPSLQNQYLVDNFLKAEWSKFKIQTDLEEADKCLKKLNEQSSGIASFPNKFVFLCNGDDAEKICKSISVYIQKEWIKLSEIVKNFIADQIDTKINEENTTYSKIWNNTIETFWKYSWAATNFLDISESGKDAAASLLTSKKYSNELDALLNFSKAENLDTENLYSNAKMYGATHSLAQGLLAAGKTKPTAFKNPEKGYKCPLCGEHEVLHNFDYEQTTVKASAYNDASQKFWSQLGDVVNFNKGKSEEEKEYIQIGKNERLCAVCAVKRLLPIALKKNNSHLLYNTLVKGVDSFPSTTSMAFWNFLKNKPEKEKASLAQKIHRNELSTEELNEGSRYDKYYAFLLMDGDKMGDLVNGDSIEATWKDVLSSELVERFKSPDFCPNSPFKKDLLSKERTINPALHAMISDSLNNFARYGVQPAFYDKDGNTIGRLIYAGGDDVCAILPLSEAFRIANEIRKTYTYSFAGISKDTGKLEEISGTLTDLSKYSKIGMHLGSGAKKISISGAIIIAHHKQPLREVIKTAHSVLDGVAKTKSGRNSLAIRFIARSGGARDVWFKWDEQGLFGMKKKDAFDYVLNSAKSSALSTSLLYNMENLQGVLEPLATDLDSEKVKEQILSLFEYEVNHSGIKVGNKKELSRALATICMVCAKTPENEKNWFNPDAAVIASFMAGAGTSESEVSK